MSPRKVDAGRYYQTLDAGTDNHGRVGAGWHCDCDSDPKKAVSCPRLRWYSEHPEDLIKHQAQS